MIARFDYAWRGAAAWRGMFPRKDPSATTQRDSPASPLAGARWCEASERRAIEAETQRYGKPLRFKD